MFILFVYDNLIPSVEIVRNSFANELVSCFGMETLFRSISEIKTEDISRADAVVMIRPNTLLELDIARIAKRSGRILATILDDDLLNVPDDYTLCLHNVSWRKKALKETCFLSDLFISCNRLLCEKYGKYMENENTMVLDTVVDEKDLSWDRTERRDGEVKLVYAAGKNHEPFFNEFVLPIIPKLFEKYGDSISLTFFGVAPKMPDSCGKYKIEYVGHMPLNEYREKIRSGGYDIGLAPLESTEFTKYKYYNKFIEYTISGIPGIYSDAEPISLIVKSGTNGILAGNTPEEWLSAICTLIDDEKLRIKCLDNARNLLRNEFNRDHVTGSFEKRISELLPQNGKSEIKGSLVLAKIRYRFERAAECFIQFFVYIKNAGLKAAFKKCAEHISKTF